MIPKNWILHWGAIAPWSLESQIEQDLVLSRIIIEIFSDPFLSSILAFRGGTALHKIFLEQPVRYSEDIDFVMIKQGPIGEMMDGIRAKIDPWLGVPRRTRSESRVKLLYNFETESQPVVNMRVKIEINAVENFTLLGLQNKSFSMDSPWFSGSANVTTYSIEELLGTKLRALYQRKKGRDLFDLFLCIKEYPELCPQTIVDCFQHYLSKEGLKVSRAEFEANLENKIADALFMQDLKPLLAANSKYEYSPIEAHYMLREKVINLLPGEPWKQS